MIADQPLFEKFAKEHVTTWEITQQLCRFITHPPTRHGLFREFSETARLRLKECGSSTSYETLLDRARTIVGTRTTLTLSDDEKSGPVIFSHHLQMR